MSTMQRKDKWIPWYFVVFFLVVVAVNAVMVTLAVRTQTGLVTDHAYEKGIAYNQTIAQEAQQEALGWHAEMKLQDNLLRVTLRDRNGKVITPDDSQVHVARPATAGMDFDLTLTGAATAITFPAKGLWELRLFAEKDGKHYQQVTRVVVP